CHSLSTSLLAQQQVHDPAAADVWPRPAQVRKQRVGETASPAARLTLTDLPGRHPDPADTDLAIFFTVAARVFEGVGQDRQQVEFPIVVDRADKTHDSSGSPSRVVASRLFRTFLRGNLSGSPRAISLGDRTVPGPTPDVSHCSAPTHPFAANALHPC